jgi:hypothetical protein
MSQTAVPPALDTDNERVIRQAADAIRSIRYGSVEVVIQNGRIVQIEVREKRRFDPSAPRR